MLWKKASRIKTVTLFSAAFAVPLFSQAVYEAEATVNTLTGSAKVDVCTPCSGKKNVQYLGGSGNGTLRFNGVAASVAGNYSIAVTYDNGTTGDMPATMMVNGGNAQTVPFHATGSWSTLSQANVTVPLKAGSNTFYFKSARGNYVAEIDKITVTQQGGQQSPPPPPTPQPPSTNTVSLTSFGSTGRGGDDTQVIQSALNSTAANSETLEIPQSTQPYNTGPLTIPSNAKIIVDPGVTVMATSGYSQGQRMLNIVDVNNVSITGTPGSSIFQMRKAEYTTGEYRHCLDIEGSNNVTISGIACNDSGGDGLYIGEGSQGYSNDVVISNSTFDNNRRQGFSLISGKNITIDGCHFTNTSGTAPQSGIDVEPNGPSDVIQNVVFKNSSASGNAGNGLMVSFWLTSPASAPVSLTVTNFSTSNNQSNGFFVENEHDTGSGGPSGSILIQNSSSSNDGGFGAVASYYDTPGPMLTFQNISVTNPNQSGSNWDGAAIGVKRGGGDASQLGNVTFTGTSITDNGGHIQTYFTIEDYSSVALKNIHIGSFGTLSGAPSGDPIGIVNGNPQTSVNIP